MDLVVLSTNHEQHIKHTCQILISFMMMYIFFLQFVLLTVVVTWIRDGDDCIFLLQIWCYTIHPFKGSIYCGPSLFLFLLRSKIQFLTTLVDYDLNSSSLLLSPLVFFFNYLILLPHHISTD